MEKEKVITIPDFLNANNFTQETQIATEGCSDIIETVQKEMAKEITDDLAKVRNGQRIITENEREKIKATVNSWSEEQQKEVCRIISADILLEVIGEGIKELHVMKKEIAALSRHNKGV